MAYVQPSHPCPEQRKLMESLGFRSIYTHQVFEAWWTIAVSTPEGKTLEASVKLNSSAVPTAHEAMVLLYTSAYASGAESVRADMRRVLGAASVNDVPAEFRMIAY